MFSFLARMIGLLSLVIAVITAVIDITKSIAASDIVLTPLGATWAGVSFSSIQLAQAAIQRYVHPLIWDPGIQFFLSWPTWLFFGVLALLFLMLGRRRRKRANRFAGRSGE